MSKVKGPNFTPREDGCLLAWLKVNKNKFSTKITLAKALHAHLIDRRVSPHGVNRSFDSIRCRLPQLEKEAHKGI